MVIVRGELQYIETWESERFITGAGGISGIRPILVKIVALHIHNVPCHSSSSTTNVIMIRGHRYLRVW
jgi:hypothetical protein